MALKSHYALKYLFKNKPERLLVDSVDLIKSEYFISLWGTTQIYQVIIFFLRDLMIHLYFLVNAMNTVGAP